MRLEPGYALAHNELGIALQGAPGASDEAIGQFREALRIEPDFAIAHHNLGLALAQSGRTREAIWWPSARAFFTKAASSS